MYIDKRTQFGAALALSTAATGLALIGDVIDLSVARDIGVGDTPLYLVIQVTTAVTSAGAATVEFQLVSDAQAAIAVDGTASVHYKSAAIAKATLEAGYYAVVVALPQEGVAYERYLGILQNVGTAALTAGAINAFLTLDVGGKWKPYADGIA